MPKIACNYCYALPAFVWVIFTQNLTSAITLGQMCVNCLARVKYPINFLFIASALARAWGSRSPYPVDGSGVRLGARRGACS